MKLGYKELSEVFSYDPSSGCIRWKVARVAARVGTLAGAIDRQGYRNILAKIGEGPAVNILAHRLAWLLHHQEWPTQCIDHINGERADNRIVNLRDVSSQENNQNRLRPGSHGTSGLLGVSNQCGRWVANIRRPGVGQVYLGRFETKEEAYAAYLTAKAEFHHGWVR